MVERRSGLGKNLAPNLEGAVLGNEILATIKNRLLDLSGLGLSEKHKDLKCQDISAPRNSIDFVSTVRLKKMGLPMNFANRFVILVKNENSKFVDGNTIGVSVKDDLSLGELLHVDLILPLDDREDTNIYLKSEAPLGFLGARFFRRDGTRETVFLGNVGDGKEAVLLVDGSAKQLKVFNLILPNNWRDAVDENGMLTGGDEEKKNRPVFVGVTPADAMTIGYENPAETRESKLQDEVVRRIKNHLKKLGLEFNPQDISVPSIQLGYSHGESSRMVRDALDEVGLPAGFHAIWVGKQKEKSIVVAGRALGLGTKLYLGSATNANIIAGLKYDHGRNPSVFINNEKIEDTVITLGNSWDTKEMHVLLIVNKDGKHEISSVALPHGWGSVFDKEGKWIEKPVEIIEQTKAASGVPDLIQRVFDSIRERVGKPIVFPENQAKKEEVPQLTYAQMLKEVEGFPFYRGPALGKEGIRTAIFGKRQTPVEIKVLDNGSRIAFKFCGLNLDQLKKVCEPKNVPEKDKLDIVSFVSCFEPGFESRDNLVLVVAPDTNGQTKLEGKLIRWDIGKGREADSLQYLGSNLDQHELDKIKRIINDEKFTLPYFFSQLKAPENEPEVPVRTKATIYHHGERPEKKKQPRAISPNYQRYLEELAKISHIRSTYSDGYRHPNDTVSYIGSPSPGFKNRTEKGRKDESKRYRTQKEQRKAEFHKRQKKK